MAEYSEKILLTSEIENYSFWNQRCGEFLQSPPFTIKNFFGSIWYIIFYISEGENSEEFISIKLCTEHCVNLVTINFKIELCNSEKEFFFIVGKKSIQFYAESKYLLPNVIRKLELEKKMKNFSEDKLFIRCWLEKGKNFEIDNFSNECSIVKTKIYLDQLFFMWNLKYRESSRWSSSKIFPINDEMQLCINVSAPGDDVLFEICEVRQKTKYLRRIKCEITLLDYQGTEKFSICDFFTFGEEFAIWRIPQFLKRSLIKKYIKHQSLRLKVNFSVSNDLTFIDCVDETDHQDSLSSLAVSKIISSNNYLTNDLRAMLFDKEFADVSFKIDDTTITAHKCILALRSPVFSVMFKQNMLEKETGVIHVADMDVQTLRLFLEFVYTGVIEQLECERALSLLLAAEKYQVLSLKEKCSEILKASLNTDNICDVVSVANMVGEQCLKTAAVDYIKENASQILGSPMWLNWAKQNVELCSEVFYSLSQKFKTMQKKN